MNCHYDVSSTLTLARDKERNRMSTEKKGENSLQPSIKDEILLIYFRVFKKGSPNGKITVYLGRRDFVDHITHVDPIDGVVLVDPEYLKDRKVYGHVLAAFRYGREDLDVLGLTFRKDLYLASAQIYPEEENAKKRPLSRLQVIYNHKTFDSVV